MEAKVVVEPFFFTNDYILSFSNRFDNSTKHNHERKFLDTFLKVKIWKTSSRCLGMKSTLMKLFFTKHNFKDRNDIGVRENIFSVLQRKLPP